jgi:opacity protein-like surface antigen
VKRLLAVVLLAAACGLMLAAPGSAASAPQPAAAGIGIAHSFGVDSVGWGTVRPKRLFNGGDPSGLIVRIHWRTWGARIAHGHGKNYIFKPGGGYYGHPVTIRLRATDLTRCGHSGQVAYHHLYVRAPSKPGGRFGKWRIWTSYHRDLCTQFG